MPAFAGMTSTMARTSPAMTWVGSSFGISKVTLLDDAGAGREHPDIGAPHADIAPAANAALAGALIFARAAAIVRPAAGAHGDALAILPDENRRDEPLLLCSLPQIGERPSAALARGQREEAS